MEIAFSSGQFLLLDLFFDCDEQVIYKRSSIKTVVGMEGRKLMLTMTESEARESQ